MNEIIELINKYWKFDDDQQHLSTWHDKQELLQGVSNRLDKPVKSANGGVDMDNCFYCGHRASELTQIRVAIKPSNTPNRWRVIGVACNTCNDKFISQINPSRLSV